MNVWRVVGTCAAMVAWSVGASVPAWASGTIAGEAPTITALSDQTVAPSAKVGPILFTIGDDDTAADQLIVTASSSNAAVLPHDDIVLGGSGTTRSLTAQTVWQAVGTTTITVSVSDGTQTTTATFTVTAATTLTYFLAEGATGDFFDTDILIAAPFGDILPVRITFFKDDGTTVVHNLSVGLLGRTTIHVDQIPGLEATSFSALVESLVPSAELAVERTMRWDASGYGAHTEKATLGTSREWLFAEGSQGFFFTYFLLVNPQTTANSAHVTYFREGLPPIVRDYALLPTSRRTIDAGADPELVNTSFGARVVFDQPGMAERAMYFGSNPLFAGGHDSAGVTKASREWFLAEGATGSFFTTFVLLANPGEQPADVTLTYLPASGDPVVRHLTMPAGQRVTRNIADEDPSLASAAVGVRVDATQPIVVERSQYWPNPFSTWYEAHNSFGVTEIGQRWGLAEGGVGGATDQQTYILLANPGAEAADVAVSFLALNGSVAPRLKTFTVPPTSRRNVAVTGPGSDAPELANEPFSAIIDASVPIVVERSFYASPNGLVFSAGTNATGTRFKVPTPIAPAGPDQVNVPVGTTVTVGQPSPIGPIPGFTYQWTLLSKPAGSSAALSSTTAATPTFVVDVAGDYVAQLVVTATANDVHNTAYRIKSAPETVLVTTTRPPVDVSVVATDGSASEVGLDPASLTFSRTGDLSQALTLPILLTDPTGNSTDGLDYAPIGRPFQFSAHVPFSPSLIKRVTIPAGQANLIVPVTPLADNFVETPETFGVSIVSDRRYFVTGGPAMITIADNPPVVEVVATDNMASETGGNTGTFTFTRTGGNLAFPLIVRFDVTGTALSGPDHLLETTVMIPANETSVAVTFTPVADSVAEGPETVIVTLFPSDQTFVPGAANTATVTIVD